MQVNYRLHRFKSNILEITFSIMSNYTKVWNKQGTTIMDKNTYIPLTHLKGLFTGSGNRFNLSVWNFSIPMAAMVDFMVSGIGQIAQLLLLVHFEPIHDTI